VPNFPEALHHGPITEPFTNVFFVTGQMQTTFPEFPGVDWSFNRNMTIVRDGDELTLINSVRLGDDGLAALEQLGRVAHVARIGALHDRDDAFYVDRYRPTFWTLPGIEPDHRVDERLTPGGPTPFAGCTVFAFESTQLPEGVLIIERGGGIAVGCDALQNWIGPDEHFDAGTIELMTQAGFFQPANFGPLFMMRSQPKASDYERLLALPFRHALCGHGEPLRESAHEAYAARAAQTFAE
jgi:hypothetical protein